VIFKRIDEIADVNPRLNKAGIPDDLEVSFVPMPAVGAGNGKIDVSESKTFVKAKKGFTSFVEGDVLFAKITPCMENGKMAVVPEVQNGYGFGSTEFHVLRAKAAAVPRYIYYFVSSKEFRGEAERHMTGAVGQRRVPTTYLKEQKVPIPEIGQQKKIVEEIEKQFSRLDKTVADLKRVKANLKRYKASVLQAAVTGKLTEAWRKQHLPAPVTQPGKFYTYAILCEDDSIYIGHTNDIERRWQEHREGQGAEWTKEHRPVKIAHYEAFDSREEASEREKWLKTGFGRKWIKRELVAGRTRQAGDVEPASKLLELIEAEKIKWIDQGIGEGNSEAKRLKSKLKRHKFSLPDNIEIPEMWSWASLLTASHMVVDCHNKTAPYEARGIPLVRTTNIRDGKVDIKSAKYITETTYQYWSRRCPPKSGDILFTREAPMGEAAIIPEDTKLCMGQRMMLIRVFEKLLLPKFLLSVIMSPVFQQGLIGNAVGTGVKHLRVGDVEAFALAIPPLEEQKIIVEEVESRLSVAGA